MARAVPTIGVTVRLPGELHERVVDHRTDVRIPTNTFIVEAITEKLDREQQQSKPKQRRRAAG